MTDLALPNPRHLKYALDEQQWKRFRERHPRVIPDLRNANLEEAGLQGDFSRARFDGARLKKASMPAQLDGASFQRANLRLAKLDGQATYRNEIGRRNTDFRDAHMTGCCLRHADFSHADFTRADLRGAMFEGALLTDANFSGANLLDARFDGATLTRARFAGANLRGATFTNCICEWTVFDAVDLSATRGLETIEHLAPSTVSVATLYRSGGRLPDAFIAGAHPDADVGMLRNLRDALRQLPFEYHSCFISYAREDAQFVDLLTRRMKQSGIGHWMDRDSLRAGEAFEDVIGQAIARFDKFVVVLSETSLRKTWVRKEVELALQIRKDDIVPVRLDGSVIGRVGKPWSDLMQSKHIGDFSSWKSTAHFRQQFDSFAGALRRD